MGIQYVTNEDGEKTAVLIPIEQWKIIQNISDEDPEDALTAEEAARADEAWSQYKRGEGKTLAEVKRALQSSTHEF